MGARHPVVKDRLRKEVDKFISRARSRVARRSP
jgi:hypothetical protein